MSRSLRHVRMYGYGPFQGAGGAGAGAGAVSDKLLTLPLVSNVLLNNGTGPVDTSDIAAGLSVDDNNGDTWTCKLHETRFTDLRREHSIVANGATPTTSNLEPIPTAITTPLGNVGRKYDDPTKADVGEDIYDYVVAEPTNGRTFMVTMNYKFTYPENNTIIRVTMNDVSAGATPIIVQLRSGWDTDWHNVTMWWTGAAVADGFMWKIESQSTAETLGFQWGDITVSEVEQASATQNSMPFIDADTDYFAGANGVKYFPSARNIMDTVVYGDSFTTRDQLLGIDMGSLLREYGTETLDMNGAAGHTLADIQSAFNANLPVDPSKLYIIWDGWNATYTTQGEADTSMDVYHTGDGSGILEKLKAAGARFIVISTTAEDTAGQYAGTAGRDWLDEVNTHIADNYPDNYVDVLSAYVTLAGTTGAAGDDADFTNGVLPGSLRSDTIHLQGGYGYVLASKLVNEKIVANGWDKNTEGVSITGMQGFFAETGEFIRVPSENFDVGDKVITFDIRFNATPTSMGIIGYDTTGDAVGMKTNSSSKMFIYAMGSGVLLANSAWSASIVYKNAIVIKTAGTVDFFVSGVKQSNSGAAITDVAAIEDCYIGADNGGTGPADFDVTNFVVFNDLKNDAYWEAYTTVEDEIPVSADLFTTLVEDNGLEYSYVRPSTATVLDYLGNRVTAGIDEARFAGARRIDHGNSTDYGCGVLGIEYSGTEPDGTPLTTLKGYLSEESRTNFFLNSDAPITQTIDLSNDNYCIWIEGSGTVTATATGGGTAVAVEFPAVCTSGNTAPFRITTGGEVDFTITGGTPTIVQVENGYVPTSYVPTTTEAVTRGADYLNYRLPIMQTNEFTILCNSVPAWQYNEARGTIDHPILWISGIESDYMMMRTSQTAVSYVGKAIRSSTDYEDIASADNFAAGDTVKSAYIKKSTGLEVVVDGNAGTEEGTAGDPVIWGPTLSIGYNEGIEIDNPGETSGWYNGSISEVKIILRPYTQAEAITATA